MERIFPMFVWWVAPFGNLGIITPLGGSPKLIAALRNHLPENSLLSSSYSVVQEFLALARPSSTRALYYFCS